MGSLAEFLRTLLHEGKVIVRDAPMLSPGEQAEPLQLLENAFQANRLEVAGPAIDFSPKVALSAADLFWHAAWFLVTRQESQEEVESVLRKFGSPGDPADHLSADLVLRYLPAIHRRAHAHDPADKLTTCLETILRTWPLSGVLSDVVDGPLQSIDFGGHPGLLMLYAERLAAHEKPAWFPTDGLARQYVELVWQERGRELSSIPDWPSR